VGLAIIPKLNPRTKHMDIKWWWLKPHIEEEQGFLVKRADILTKSLGTFSEHPMTYHELMRNPDERERKDSSLTERWYLPAREYHLSFIWERNDTSLPRGGIWVLSRRGVSKDRIALTKSYRTQNTLVRKHRTPNVSVSWNWE
jgi:hypothetical protein